MRLKQVRLIKFKRFDDLTIDLGQQPSKIVALVGPNGCGKSSIFDAFEQILQNYVGAARAEQNWFYSKSWFDDKHPSQTYSRNDAIRLTTSDGQSSFGPKSFYVRSAYRYTPSLRINAIQAKGDILQDTARPGSSIGLDQRLQGNYERLLGRLLTSFWKGDKTGVQTRAELIDQINIRLHKVLDITVSELGDVTEGKGQLFFEKGSSKNFPFENLSAGEKEVVDMLIDLEVKLPTYNDTIYCIDEPELHLNTAIQRKLLIELAELIPETCQLWVATHSIGFLRALQQNLRAQAQILDFSERDYFSTPTTIFPLGPTRANWKRIFNTALEDLTGLISPKAIIYCEGREEASPTGEEQGLDASIYNAIFERSFTDTLFVSSGGGGAQTKHSELALKVLGKAFDDVTLLLLKDRDGLSNEQRQAFLDASPTHRMLERREIENYLFDQEILEIFCSKSNSSLDKSAYDSIIKDIATDDLKTGQILQKLTQLCNYGGRVSDFKKALARYITPDTTTYSELKKCVFEVTA